MHETLYVIHDMFSPFIVSTAPLRGSRLACIAQQKGVACRRADHKCSSVDPRLPQYGDCCLNVVAEPVPSSSSETCTTVDLCTRSVYRTCEGNLSVKLRDFETPNPVHEFALASICAKHAQESPRERMIYLRPSRGRVSMCP